MVNHFREQMPRPIVALGHSMGGCQLTYLSLLHPRLFETIILIDPVIQRFTTFKGNYEPANASARRRDVWPSREAAAAAFKRSRFYKSWDPRVLDLWIKYGLRDLPTALIPSSESMTIYDQTSSPMTPLTTEPTLTPSPGPAVTLTTTKHQEVFSFLRPNFPPEDPSKPGPHSVTEQNPYPLNSRTHPDIVPTANPQVPFYRSESLICSENLPHVRPSVFYIFGTASNLSEPELRNDKLSRTGVGVSGSGGVPAGRVKSYVMEGGSHLMPMERVNECADQCADWFCSEIRRWQSNEVEDFKDWEGKTKREKQTLSARYLDMLRNPGSARQTMREKL
jgi:pimeloyl-ACP methyl ester carboxylesterase